MPSPSRRCTRWLWHCRVLLGPSGADLVKLVCSALRQVQVQQGAMAGKEKLRALWQVGYQVQQATTEAATLKRRLDHAALMPQASCAGSVGASMKPVPDNPLSH